MKKKARAEARRQIVEALLAQQRKLQTTSNAIEYASADESFRRSLQDKLQYLGQGKRGARERNHPAERRALEGYLELAKARIGGRATTNKAAAWLVENETPYRGMDPGTLLKRVQRGRK